MSLSHIQFLPLLLCLCLCILQQEPSECGDDQYYNQLTSACSFCPENSYPSSDKLTCICLLRFRREPATGENSFACTLCTNGFSFPPFLEQCFPVSAGATFNETSGVLICGNSDEVPYLTSNSDIACRACGDNEGIGEEDGRRVCVPCPDPRQENIGGTCTCAEGFTTPTDAENVCVPADADTTLPASVTNSNPAVRDENAELIGWCRSEYMETHLHAESYRCNCNANITACQHLANLCVMQLYAESEPACQIYKEFLAGRDKVAGENIDDNWKKDFPWIFYATDSEVLKEDEQFTQRIAFNPKGSSAISKFDFWVAKFTMNGTFLGIDNLLPSFFLCPKATFEQINDFSKVGANLKYVCEFDLNDAMDTETIFYELFVMNSDGKLIDVPVNILNPPADTGIGFARRFFMFDSIGLMACKDEPTEKFVRYANMIRLGITLQPSEKERIYRPILEINYNATSVASIEAGNNIASFTMRVLNPLNHRLNIRWT